MQGTQQLDLENFDLFYSGMTDFVPRSQRGNSTMVRKLLALFIIATFALSTAHADILFEGYYKVISG